MQILESGRIPIIIDAGANIGASAIWFASLFPSAKILAVEPDPINANLCTINCKRYSNVSVIEAAIGSVPGNARLVRPDTMSWSIQIERSDGEGSVQLTTVDELLSPFASTGVLFIAKIDIEGFERDLFSSATQWLADVAAVIIELHDWLIPYSSIPFQKAIARCEAEMAILGENLIFIS
jgi:FkbM family methyltransferase